MDREMEEREQKCHERAQQEVDWLSSLSHSELDMLISLKEMVLLRAKNAGCEDLAEKFNLRMLRALGVILLEYLEERIEKESIFPNAGERLKLLSSLRLVPLDRVVKVGSMESAKGSKVSKISTPRQKRTWEGPCEEGAHSCKKQKVTDSNI